MSNKKTSIRIKLLKIFLIFISCFSVSISSQAGGTDYSSIDHTMANMPEAYGNSIIMVSKYIKENYSSQTEKIRAIYYWIGTSFTYDAENVFVANLYEKKEEKIIRMLRTKRGVSDGYMAVFSEVCSKVGIKCYVIEGYTRQNGFTEYIPHSWATAFVDGNWYFFDPVWGSLSYVGNQFVKNLNSDYFRASAGRMIRTHMPFDPLWQLSYGPVNNQEFYDRKTESVFRPIFNWVDSLRAYEKQTEIERLVHGVYRIEKNGIKNGLTLEYQNFLLRQIETIKQDELRKKFNTSLAYFNQAKSKLSSFVAYRNNRFSPVRSDLEIQTMLSEVEIPLKAARAKLVEIKSTDPSARKMLSTLAVSFNELSKKYLEQKDFVTRYVQEDREGRRRLFR